MQTFPDPAPFSLPLCFLSYIVSYPNKSKIWRAYINPISSDLSIPTYFFVNIYKLLILTAPSETFQVSTEPVGIS